MPRRLPSTPLQVEVYKTGAVQSGTQPPELRRQRLLPRPQTERETHAARKGRAVLLQYVTCWWWFTRKTFGSDHQRPPLFGPIRIGIAPPHGSLWALQAQVQTDSSASAWAGNYRPRGRRKFVSVAAISGEHPSIPTRLRSIWSSAGLTACPCIQTTNTSRVGAAKRPAGTNGSRLGWWCVWAGRGEEARGAIAARCVRAVA